MADHYFRQSMPGYIGVLREGDVFRVIAAQAPDRSFYYRVQFRGPVFADGLFEWMPVSGSSSSSLSVLFRKCGGSVPGFADLVHALPDDPAKAAPWLAPLREARYA